jgi:nucleoside-diphosphate-sugar epimerase
VVILDNRLPQEGDEEHWLLDQVHAQPRLVKGDVTDLASLIRIAQTHHIQGIIHTAALTDVELLAESPTVSLHVNTGGTVNVLETARSLHMEKVVLSSSIAVYAPLKYEPVDEEHPVLSPDSGPALTSYTSSKIAAECFGMHYWAQYGIGFIALRLSGIYGFGMRYPLYIKPVVEAVAQDRELDLGPVGDTARDLIYVEDAAAALVSALEVESSGLTSRIFNCGGGRMVRVLDMVRTMRELEPNSRVAVSPGLTDTERVIQKSRGRLSLERAKAQLGFVPSYGLKEGLKSYLDLQRQYLKRQGAG